MQFFSGKQASLTRCILETIQHKCTAKHVQMTTVTAKYVSRHSIEMAVGKSIRNALGRQE